MGWHPIGPQDQGVTGDLPVDEMSRAVGRIGRAYRERFGRPPLLAELVHALRVVLLAAPEQVLDGARIASDFPLPSFPASVPMRLDTYDVALSEEPAPHGTFHVTERATGREVLRCVIRREGATLFVDHAAQAEVADSDVRRMIRWLILQEFLGDDYRGEAAAISFARAEKPGDRTVEPYG